MLIALDYDDTFTKDPDLWIDFIKKANLKDHKIICVTMRYSDEGEEVLKSIGKYCEVIFTSRNAKLQYLSERNIFPDVWIDDNPRWLYVNG